MNPKAKRKNKEIKKVDVKKLQNAGWSDEIIVLFEKINEVIEKLNKLKNENNKS